MKPGNQSTREHPKKNPSIGTQNSQSAPPSDRADNGSCEVDQNFSRQLEQAGTAYKQHGDNPKNLPDDDGDNDDEQGRVDPDEIDEALDNRRSRPD